MGGADGGGLLRQPGAAPFSVGPEAPARCAHTWNERTRESVVSDTDLPWHEQEMARRLRAARSAAQVHDILHEVRHIRWDHHRAAAVVCTLVAREAAFFDHRLVDVIAERAPGRMALLPRNPRFPASLHPRVAAWAARVLMAGDDEATYLQLLAARALRDLVRLGWADVRSDVLSSLLAFAVREDTDLIERLRVVGPLLEADALTRAETLELLPYVRGHTDLERTLLAHHAFPACAALKLLPTHGTGTADYARALASRPRIWDEPELRARLGIWSRIDAEVIERLCLGARREAFPLLFGRLVPLSRERAVRVLLARPQDAGEALTPAIMARLLSIPSRRVRAALLGRFAKVSTAAA